MNRAATEVRIARNPRLPAFAAGLTGLVAAAYIVRAAGSGGVVDVLVFAVLAAMTVAHLYAVRDARTPLLVADEHGVRLRIGRTWRGLPWEAVEQLEHRPRPTGLRGRVRDGRLTVVPIDPEALLGDLDTRGRWSNRVSTLLHGGPFALPLGLTTSVHVEPVESDECSDLTSVLATLAGSRAQVVEVGSEPTAEADPVETQPVPEPAVLVRQPMDADDSPTATVVVADLADLPLVDPVIGPVLKTARERLRLSVDQLAERTRIRAHVLEAVEIDDFAPCGGDFYARGHLRTLARVLGVDAGPLLETYDARYADAPVDPLRVLAADRIGRDRTERSRPGASVLVAAVMATVLVWSVARLLMDTPVTVAPVTPTLADGSAGLASRTDLAPPVEVSLTATGGGAHVVVRDGAGVVVFKDSIPFGATHALMVRPPVRVQSSDGSLEVTVDGVEQGRMGRTGSTAQDVYTASR